MQVSDSIFINQNFNIRECAILGDYDGSIGHYKKAIQMTDK